jgi:N-acetylglucosamine-6-sulfatase
VKRGKHKVYEPSVGVPTLMRGPGVPRGKLVPELAANVDLAATIVDAAEAGSGRALDGVSLLDLAQRPSDFSSREVLLENGTGGGGGNAPYAAIRTPRYKYVEYATGERELYDLDHDPFEQRSVHRDQRYADVRRRLAATLQRLRNCAGAACRR